MHGHGAPDRPGSGERKCLAEIPHGQSGERVDERGGHEHGEGDPGPPSGPLEADRDQFGQLLDRDPSMYSTASMTYDLRRLRLHGLIERIPETHRYRITDAGARAAMFYARLYARALRPVASLQPVGTARAQRAFDRLDTALAQFLEEAIIAA